VNLATLPPGIEHDLGSDQSIAELIPTLPCRFWTSFSR